MNDENEKREKEYVEVIKEFGEESRRLWKLAGPAIFTSICQYSLGALTQTFAGLAGELELAAVSVENSVIAGLAFGVMVVGETTEISEAAGKFALWMLPQLFAYALNFPIQKFLQAQSKVMVMAWISAVVLVEHAFLSWLLILKLGWGLPGAALVLNSSWWLIVIAQLIYIFKTKSDGAWSGFSWLAFQDLFGFVKLSLSSALMLCMNINGWDAMIALGFNAAISVRVSNELGAGNAKAAKFSVVVVCVTSMIVGAICMSIVIATRDYFPYLFTTSEAVAAETTRLAILLAVTVLLNSLQPVLSGVAIGAGWQSLVAYINIGCYYIVGLPTGILLGFKFGFGAEAEEAESRVRKWGGSAGEE
ncbi:hypothetical protein FEM48_Zijuj06G0076400 [Ziziphus jujuba var. spinosa]|uniref:Uncharacterized protein n=1 Tax=Ziziphus jujuba var. spinosa TaxID=714518 RepID=A0A978V808_ZIZJJ|nr:hypothetical protein FEM48_Zijuj06G0076400 [Ziziphus jujuba var. spinosa]